MGYLKIENLETGKVEHESGIRPDNFFTDRNAAINPTEATIKSPADLERDLKAEASFIDFKSHAHATIQYFEAIGSWEMANIFRRILDKNKEGS